MKPHAVLAIAICAVLLTPSCKQVTKQRIVSKTPIKTEVLGMKLCDVSSEKAIEKAVSKEISKQVYTESEKVGTGTIVRVIPFSLDLNYGGQSWHYVDVWLDENKKIVEIRITASFESVERAKDHFDTATQIFSQKYGKPNEEQQNVFWTDDTNSVGLLYHESSAINGDDRSFCELYYVNRELVDAFEKANTPDV